MHGVVLQNRVFRPRPADVSREAVLRKARAGPRRAAGDVSRETIFSSTTHLPAADDVSRETFLRKGAVGISYGSFREIRSRRRRRATISARIEIAISSGVMAP